MAAVVESAQAQSALQPVITAAHRIKEIVRLRNAPFFFNIEFWLEQRKEGEKDRIFYIEIDFVWLWLIFRRKHVVFTNERSRSDSSDHKSIIWCFLCVFLCSIYRFITNFSLNKRRTVCTPPSIKIDDLFDNDFISPFTWFRSEDRWRKSWTGLHMRNRLRSRKPLDECKRTWTTSRLTI